MGPHCYRFYSFTETCDKCIASKIIFCLFKNLIYIIEKSLFYSLQKQVLAVLDLHQ